MEHMISIEHGGGDELENLALACAECNLKKSSDLAGIDPDTMALTPQRENDNPIPIPSFDAREKCPRLESNQQPSASEADALSN